MNWKLIQADVERQGGGGAQMSIDEQRAWCGR